jgi:hypothetical protein
MPLREPSTTSEASILRHQLRDAYVETDRLRKLAEKEAARADSQYGDANAARRASACATSEAERLSREVIALRVARDNTAAALEDSNTYAKKLENKVAGPGGFLVDQNAKLRHALTETVAQHSVSNLLESRGLYIYASGK